MLCFFIAFLLAFFSGHSREECPLVVTAAMQKGDIDGSSIEEEEESMHLVELKDAFTSALTANGVLGKIKAQLRASAVSLLRGDPELAAAAVGRTMAPDRMALESKVALLLIRQFLVSHDMSATAGVFEAESSLTEVGTDAQDLFGRLFARGADDCPLTALVREAIQNPDGPAVTRANSGTSLAPVQAAKPEAEVEAAPAPNPNAEQLDLLASVPEVATVLEGLHDSFSFSDTEGALDPDLAYDRIDNAPHTAPHLLAPARVSGTWWEVMCRDQNSYRPSKEVDLLLAWGSDPVQSVGFNMFICNSVPSLLSLQELNSDAYRATRELVMGLRRTCGIRAAKPWLNEAQHNKFLKLLGQCGIPTTSIPATPAAMAAEPKFHIFTPLFTPHFDFHQHQLTTLGDTLVDEYLATALMDYSLHASLLVSVPSAKQWNAVWHNHFAMRRFANELEFGELAIPLTADFSVGSKDGPSTERMKACLRLLEARRTGPSRRDLAGTSFATGTLPCGQSPLGWKFSHFVGAVHQAFGPAAVASVLEYVYQLRGSGNIMFKAADFLLQLLATYPAPNVAEALLAAQGLPVRYVGITRLIGPAPREEAEPRPPAASAPSPAGVIHIAGFGAEAAGASAEVTLDSLLQRDAAAPGTTLLDGPGQLDLIEEWRRRNAAALTAAPDLAATVGWLPPEAQRAAQVGPAFADAVDVSLSGAFADAYGEPDPVNGKVVSRIKHKRPPRDPLFYDKLSDMRGGVPFSTDGVGSAEKFLALLQEPHRRLFEVSMLVGQPADARLVGRSIAWKYSVARDAAAKAYLGGVLADLHRHLSSQGAPSDEETRERSFENAAERAAPLQYLLLKLFVTLFFHFFYFFFELGGHPCEVAPAFTRRKVEAFVFGVKCPLASGKGAPLIRLRTDG
eukprot:gene4150-2992_t